MKTILVIEDEVEIREIVCEILDAENFEVIDTGDGRTGLELAQAKVPDLVICDVMMPELDGYGVLAALRQNPVTEAIPFIFLTAKTAKTDWRQGIELGADDYLTKPFTRKELLGAIAARQDKQLAQEKQSQQKLSELRGNITHALPHEFRTPLNGILGLSRLLIDSYEIMDREEVVEMLEEIYTSGDRLYRLTQNFLIYADLELIATNPERIRELRRSDESTTTKSPIAEVARRKAQACNRDTDLQLALHEACVPIPETKFQKIVEELVDNAFKFSAAGTPVRIESELADDIFTLSILDLGRGMTEAQIENLGAYMQFERKLYEQQGSGLGLAIAKRLSELYRGKLAIESLPGKQTLVKVTLPGK